jgi:hypothetical protein
MRCAGGIQPDNRGGCQQESKPLRLTKDVKAESMELSYLIYLPRSVICVLAKD